MEKQTGSHRSCFPLKNGKQCGKFAHTLYQETSKYTTDWDSANQFVLVLTRIDPISLIGYN